jgi:RNA polymerase sigma-70 factor (ECF subfamily)
MPEVSEEERRVLAQFIDAHERCDAEAALAIAASDIRVTMPPAPMCFDGVVEVGSLITRDFGPDRVGDWLIVATSVNRMPAAASYLRRPGDTVFRAFKLDVLRVDGDEIAEITTFGYAMLAALGLPPILAVRLWSGARSSSASAEQTARTTRKSFSRPSESRS